MIFLECIGSRASLSAAKHYQFKIRSPILLNSKVGLFCFYISIGFTKLCLTYVEFKHFSVVFFISLSLKRI